MLDIAVFPPLGGEVAMPVGALLILAANYPSEGKPAILKPSAGIRGRLLTIGSPERTRLVVYALVAPLLWIPPNMCDAAL